MNNFKEYEAASKLNLPEAERQWVSERADMLIESFAQLETVDTAGIEPLVTILDLQNVLREDVCVKPVSRDELLSTAPEQYDGYFQVPRTLD